MEERKMDKVQRLDIINSESDYQKRLELLVLYGFKREASRLIGDLASMHSVILFHAALNTALIVGPDRSTVGVLITSSTRRGYHPDGQKEGEWHVVFELGWETKVLDWSAEQRDQLLLTAFGQALARPLNQWSINQAEGTARAARRFFSLETPIAREIAAWHLVFHLRQADFGRIGCYLSEIDGFPADQSERSIVNWIVDQLIKLGWTRDRIRKELVEWIWLKVDTWPQWVVVVAEAKIFNKGDVSLAATVRRWILQRFDYLLEDVQCRRDRRKIADAYKRLFSIARFGNAEQSWVDERLVELLVQGALSNVKFIELHFSDVFSLDFKDLATRAMNQASRVGDFGIAVALAEHFLLFQDPSWAEIVELRGLSTQLT
ncbi:hypothetical protein HN958_04605 [Candidatus Falkowbacteria bacterium]|nr:hypothetical protein [Candidatus Falkowbacteria bacterium]